MTRTPSSNDLRFSLIVAALSLGALAIGAGATGCELIASVDPDLLAQGGGGGGIPTTTSSTTTSTTTSGTTTSGGGMGGMGGMGGAGGNGGAGGGPECSVPTDCPDTGNECVARTCDAGVCGTMPVAADTPIAAQTAGDCKVVVCDGAGATMSNADDADVEIDAKACTDDTCSAGQPVHTPVMEGTACMDGGGKVCDDIGQCVECVTGADCMSGVCQGNACQAAQCGDQQKNGTETDVDCGGSCGGCGPGKMCLGNGDCLGNECTGGTCVANCFDAVKNGSESDVDCGGSCAADCAVGQVCVGDGDCTTGYCDLGTLLCAAPTCNDMAKNGSETDVDCGGVCPDCADGSDCLVSGDCSSGFCNPSTLLCAAPACNDTFKNGSETDVDCGGPTCPDCANGKTCAASTDCSSAFCNPTTLVCAAPLCNDGFKNGTETDVDCGGSCPDCALGKLCNVPGDCASQICTSGVCSQINGCDPATAVDLTGMGSTTVTFGGISYTPPCIKVSVGTGVTFDGDFTFHPLMGGEVVAGAKVPAGSGPFVPITNTGTTKTFTMSSAGTFPYYCDVHALSGMTGVVFVQ